MNTLYKAGVKGKLYRLWYKLNKNIKIKVRTACGTSKEADTGEGIGQGTIGGAIVSAGTLDDGVSEIFETSRDEICYGKVKINPLLYQDDILRMTTTHFGAQAGLSKVEAVMRLKSLEVHPDKYFHLLIGNKKNLDLIRNQIEKNPLKYMNKPIKEKKSEKWLGDFFHNGGVSESVTETIKQRKGRAKNAIFEINAIIEDTGMKIIGGQ